MRIAYIVPALLNRGPVIVVKELVEQMMKLGHQCCVFYFDTSDELVFPCETVQIKLFERIDFKNFTIVHSHGLRPDLYVYIHKRSNSNAVFLTTLHNYVLQDLSAQYNRIVAYVCGNLWMKLLRKHHLIVTLSKDAEKYYLKWFDPLMLTSAYNTRNVSDNKNLTIEEEAVILRFKGQDTLIGVNALLSPIKGVDLLIKALGSIPGFKLFVVGEGQSKESLVKLAAINKVEDRVLFVGYKKDAYRYLRYYDIFAIPSRSEGFPLSMLEAAAMKVPTVCSDINIFKEIFTSEQVSFFESENSKDLARAILHAKNSRKMADLMYEKYTLCYSPTIFGERYMEIYKSLLCPIETTL